jgi:hypothetical protein
MIIGINTKLAKKIIQLFLTFFEIVVAFLSTSDTLTVIDVGCKTGWLWKHRHFLLNCQAVGS